jgi:hypothetical protein
VHLLDEVDEPVRRRVDAVPSIARRADEWHRLPRVWRQPVVPRRAYRDLGLARRRIVLLPGRGSARVAQARFTVVACKDGGLGRLCLAQEGREQLGSSDSGRRVIG